MKEKAFFILLLFITNSYSQEKKNNFQLSLGSTIVMPKKYESTEIEPEIKSNINLGVYILPSVNHSFNKKISLDFGLGLNLDRILIEFKSYPYLYKGARNISQIQTPINVNFHFGKKNSYLFGIGGFSSYILSAKIKGKRTINSNTNDGGYNYNYSVKNYYNPFNFGAYVQLKKNISFCNKTNGFLLLKINQFFSSKNDNGYNNPLVIESIISDDEKEPTTINLGIGIEL